MPVTLTLPTEFRGAREWLLIQANSKPGLSDVNAIQDVETVCSHCTCWGPNQLYFCCLHSELWTSLPVLLLYSHIFFFDYICWCLLWSFSGSLTIQNSQRGTLALLDKNRPGGGPEP